MFLSNYSGILFFLTASVLLSSVILVLSIVLSQHQDSKEKLTTYECGFNPFEDSRIEFDVKFYLIAILFVIFDLEIAYLFPFAASFNFLGSLGLVAMFLFLFILTVGFVYE